MTAAARDSRLRLALKEKLKTAASPWVIALAATFALSLPAQALDLDNNNGLITETIASRERLKDYDNASQYGAVSVSDRDRTHVKPIGIRAGNYLIFPEVEEAIVYDNNIFGTSENAVGDFRNEIAPSIIFQSHLPRHILNMAFGGRIVNYFDNPDQDYINGNASIDGAVHIDHAHTLALQLQSQLSHEERNSISAPRAAAEPVPVWRNKAAIGITRHAGQLYGTLSAAYENWQFSEVDSIGGGTLDQDDRDFEVWSTQLRAGYRFSPGFELVSKLRFLRQLNTANPSDGTPKIDANGYEALVGVAFETNPLLRWRILGGVGLRDYDDDTLNNVNTTLLEGSFEWIPTERMTVYGGISRELIDVASGDSGSRIQTELEGRVDYDIYNNIVLSIGGSVQDAEYLAENRKDRSYFAKIGLEYYLNKNWLFTFGYEHETRDSSLDTFDMSRDRVRVGAKLRF